MNEPNVLLPEGARSSPSAQRNRGPILAALRPYLPHSGLVLEVAAGTGEHAVYNAAALPHLQWQPTDPDGEALISIAAWREAAQLSNLLAPLRLDASAPETWPLATADVIVNINMIHISPWAAAVGLMQGAGRLLQPGGILFLYGPYIEPAIPTAPSNLDFDRDLKARNGSWGLRHTDDILALAAQNRLALVSRVAMPANNIALVFERQA
jgi:SAM-dependent methyltransferase